MDKELIRLYEQVLKFGLSVRSYYDYVDLEMQANMLFSNIGLDSATPYIVRIPPARLRRYVIGEDQWSGK